MTDPKLTPPIELIQAWAAFVEKYGIADVFTTAAQWGADRELDACCEWFASKGYTVSLRAALRAARRPKPPSLKEQALDELVAAERLYPADWSTIRRALEALPE